jgi:hypothetical protein
LADRDVAPIGAAPLGGPPLANYPSQFWESASLRSSVHLLEYIRGVRERSSKDDGADDLGHYKSGWCRGREIRDDRATILSCRPIARLVGRRARIDPARLDTYRPSPCPPAIGVPRAREGGSRSSLAITGTRKAGSLRSDADRPLRSRFPQRSTAWRYAGCKFRRSHDRQTEQLAFPVAEPMASPWCWAGKPPPPLGLITAVN